MKITELLNLLEKFAPTKYAETWDNVGLMVGSPNNTVSGILVALDVTAATVAEAIHLKCNVIISHHPLIFNGLKKLDDSHYTHALVKKIIQQDMNVISFHTNLDSTPHGLNDLLAKKMGLTKLKPLIPNQLNPQAGLGRIGTLGKSTDLKSFAQHVGRKLGLKRLNLVGPLHKKMSSVAVMTGSGGGYIMDAKQAGADVLVTGDVKYHHALDAQALSLAVIDAGHYGTEIGMIELISQLLKKSRVKSNIYASCKHQDPFNSLDIK